MRKFLSCLLVSIIICSLVIPSVPVIYADTNEIRIIIDGKLLEPDVAPTIIDGRTLVPLRAIFEALGASVEWDDATSTVTAKKEGTTIVLTIDDRYPTINGVKTELDVPAMVINDRTMVPVRFIANSLGTHVEWDDATQTVYVITPKVITFSDPNLEKAVRSAVNIPIKDLKNTDVYNLEKLDASHLGIGNIKGIENLVSLSELNLSKNEISDLAPLETLTNLTSVDVSSNKISSINAFGNMKNLQELKAQYNPLKDLIVINTFPENTKIYLLDSLYPIQNRDSISIRKYESIIAKAIEITDNISQKNKTDIEKELAVHDYIAMNTKYDIESYINITQDDKCHSVYGVFFDGLAVCDGYAKAVEILLNMLGVQCTTVEGIYYSYSGQPGGHAWNIVKIDENYYHVDVTQDDFDGLRGIEMNHTYFNLSDKQMSSNRNWKKEKYPKCTADNADYASMVSLNKNIIYDLNKTYLISSGSLFSVDPSTSKATLLTNDSVLDIQLEGNWIYYINYNDDNKIYRVKTDGTGREMFFDTFARHICTKNNKLFYIEYDGNAVYCIDLNPNKIRSSLKAGGITTNIFTVDDYLYFRTTNYASTGGFSRINTNTMMKFEEVVLDIPAGFIKKDKDITYSFGVYERVSNGYLYYITTKDGKNRLMRVKLNGDDKKELSEDTINYYFFEIVGNYIYYITYENNMLYRMELDGSHKTYIKNIFK